MAHQRWQDLQERLLWARQELAYGRGPWSCYADVLVCPEDRTELTVSINRVLTELQAWPPLDDQEQG